MSWIKQSKIKKGDRTTIRAGVPRITTPAGAVKTVKVPWTRLNEGFTLLIET